MLPMTETTTYARLLRAANGSRRARRWADAAFADLVLIATSDRRDLTIPNNTLRRRRLDYRRAGIAPITEGGTLAIVATDLGHTEPEALVRLLWVLNANRVSTRAKVEARNRNLLDDAQRLLAEVAR